MATFSQDHAPIYYVALHDLARSSPCHLKARVRSGKKTMREPEPRSRSPAANDDEPSSTAGAGIQQRESQGEMARKRAKLKVCQLISDEEDVQIADWLKNHPVSL